MKRAHWMVLGVLAWGGGAFAGGLAISEQDARATGRSGTGISGESSVSAVHYNPAALTDSRGVSASAGVSAILPNVTAVDPETGKVDHNEALVRTPPHVYAGFGAGNVAVGAGFNAPFGGGLKWADDWRGRYELTEMRLETLGFHLAGAYALSPEWSVGLTASAYQVNVALDQHVDFVDKDGVAHLEGGGLGVGAAAGLTWSPAHLSPLRRVGVVARLPSAVKLSGRVHFEGVPAAFAAVAADQGITSSLTLPAKLGLGTTWAFGATTVLVEGELTFWSSMQSFDIHFENPATPEVRQARRWQQAGTFRLGVEREVLGFTARAGVLYDGAASPAETLSPSLPDSNRVGGSLGLGRSFGPVRADLAYMGIAFLPRSTAGDALPAQYSTLAHLFALTLSYGG